MADRQAKTPPERRIVFRIGVNFGDVVVDGDDLLGDGVNVAARLEQLCEPGGVLVSGTAYDHLEAGSDYRSSLLASSRSRTSSGRSVPIVWSPTEHRKQCYVPRRPPLRSPFCRSTT